MIISAFLHFVHTSRDYIIIDNNNILSTGMYIVYYTTLFSQLIY